MALNLIDPRRRQKPIQPITVSEPVDDTPKRKQVPQQVKPVGLAPLFKDSEPPQVVQKREDETERDYAMFLFYIGLPTDQRKNQRVADKFAVSMTTLYNIRKLNNWADRAGSFDAWTLITEQMALSKEQAELRTAEHGIAKTAINEFLRRYKNVPDTQIIAMVKEGVKMGRMGLGMSTSSTEIHHKHTLTIVVKKITEIAVRHIQADSMDAFRKDLSAELHALEGEFTVDA